MSQSLYERLGGADRVASIIENAVDRHAAHPLLAPRFRGRDLMRIKQVAIQFFCAGAGGPQTYEGRDMRAVHAGMNISEQELVATMDDVVAALRDHDVGDAEVNEVVAILFSLKGEVLRV